jgi:hypothetical protein
MPAQTPPDTAGDEMLEQRSDLPAGWIELIDETSGLSYYLNQANNMTTWDLPVALDSLNAPEHSSAVVGIASSEVEGTEQTPSECDLVVIGAAVEQQTPVPEETSGPKVTEPNVLESKKVPQAPAQSELPDGWMELFDEGSGKPYYFFEADNTTTWERPVAPATEAALTRGIGGAGEDDGAPKSPVIGDASTDAKQSVLDVSGMSDGSALPEGWTEVMDPSSGQPYFLNSNGTMTWDRPKPALAGRDVSDGWVEVTDTKMGLTEEESVSRKHANLVTSTPATNKTPGRPAHGVSFGFGGRICIVSRGRVYIRPTFSAVPQDPAVRIETAKCKCGIVGPLNLADDDVVASYVSGESSLHNDLLWGLIAIAAKSQGRLRTQNGVSDPDSPETAVVRLLLEDGDVSISDEKGKSPPGPQRVKSSDASASKMDNVQRLLVRGKRKEATEEALSSGNFAMALLVGSMCGREMYRHAVKQFADSTLGVGHPLHTVAMLFSGQLQLPEESTSTTSFWVSVDPEELRRSWRVHLAAIISNQTTGWHLIVLSLGDRLKEIGEIMPAHFCYMVCGASMGSPAAGTEYPWTLVGCDVKNLDLILSTESSTEAFERTEAYEWAKRRGNSVASIKILQPFKLAYAMRLADLGFLEAAGRYVQSIGECLGNKPQDANPAGPLRGPLSLWILCTSRAGLMASLKDFDDRLRCLRSKAVVPKMSGGNGGVGNRNALSTHSIDLDASFVTAQTHATLSPVARMPVKFSPQRTDGEEERVRSDVKAQVETPLGKARQQPSEMETPTLSNIERKVPPPSRKTEEPPMMLSTANETAPSRRKEPSSPVQRLRELSARAKSAEASPSFIKDALAPKESTAPRTIDTAATVAVERPPVSAAATTPGSDDRSQRLSVGNKTAKTQTAPMSAPAILQPTKGTPRRK